jgi:hypothetical protein
MTGKQKCGRDVVCTLGSGGQTRSRAGRRAPRGQWAAMTTDRVLLCTNGERGITSCRSCKLWRVGKKHALR